MLRLVLVGCLMGVLCCSTMACRRSDAPVVSPEVIEKLTADMLVKLKDPDPRARILAARFLGGQGEKAKEAIPQLQELTKDKNPEVRAVAKVALERLEGAGKSK
ncbi:MAG: non-SMC mitotic condensation complex subunit 1 [Planctomycetaceae bacterium]|nr:non-SMC mitotic condensation complex subunit 1 [Planctomycetaceae bacterium]